MANVPSRADFLASPYGSPFNGAPAALIDASLASAARRTSSSVLQTDALVEDAVFLRAALLLLKHPQGQAMRTANPDQCLIWEKELRQIQRSGTLGIRVF